MGFFTLCVAATLVVLQSTHILLQRSQSTWTFRLVEARFENHTAAETEVLAPWNPHLIVLALCLLQCLFALERVNKRYSAHPLSATGGGVVLTLILIAAAIVQGIRDTDLVHYPTMIVVGLLWLHGAWAVAASMENQASLFFDYTRAVAAPLAVLSSMLFGTRVWADALSHWALLQIAVTLGWLQVRACDARLLCRAALVLFLLLPIASAVASTGRDDQWRYVALLAGSVGLLPLLAVGTLLSQPTVPHRALAGYVLIANNAALLAVVATLANF